MSPMRWVTEAACRANNVLDTDNIEDSRAPEEVTDPRPIDKNGDLTSRPYSPMLRDIPPTGKHNSDQWEDSNREPEVMVEHIALLNGGPPTSLGTLVMVPEDTRTLTSTARTTPIETISISSTPQVSSTGIDERISTVRLICLPEGDPQIRCSICDVVDCMIHNPRH